jgi:hypothetical protein
MNSEPQISKADSFNTSSLDIQHSVFDIQQKSAPVLTGAPYENFKIN